MLDNPMLDTLMFATLAFLLAFGSIFMVLTSKFIVDKTTKTPHTSPEPQTKETNKMTPTMQVELDNLIAETKGKFFSITFVKKDGSVRVINGKDKYQRLLKGGVNHVKDAGYVPFVNRNTETWASAHKDAVVTFRCGKLVKEVSA
jgi:hypothetical protein